MQRRTLGMFAISLLGLSACTSDDTSASDTSFTSGTEDEVGTDSADTASETGSGSSSSGTSDTTDSTTGDGDTTDSTTGDGDTTDSTDSTTGDPPCMIDDDCVGDPDGPICFEGACVPCTPDNDICELGYYCAPDNTCIVGCAIDEDCPDALVCGLDNICTGCVMDANCALGSICMDGDCVEGCTDQQPCPNMLACCTGDCVDPLNDFDFCGGCDADPCPDFPHASDVCDMGVCGMGDCDPGWNNCNGVQADGCETQSACACVPGSQIDCYSGFPANTEGVGLCQSGSRTCNAMGTGYGACIGEVTPVNEVCNNNQDDNCNAQVDENPDLDLDGWGACNNDCCDQISPDCITPGLVNPGAFEVGADLVDNNCDGMIDNVLPLCDQGLASNDANPLNYAKAIDLCQFTTENPPLAQKIWGVISGNFLLASGAGVPAANSRSIRSQYGTNVLPQAGQRLAVLSSGNASYTGQNNPAFAAFQIGTNTGTSSAAPADWLAANGNALPNAPGCPAAGGTTAYNPMMLKLRVRVPTNANSFSTKMFMYSAEYPEYVCTAFNDMVITLVDSTDPGNPNDKNIAIYTAMNNQEYPIGVNLVKAASGLFSQCQNGTISQCGAPSNYNGCVSTNGLLGTGFHTNIASGCGDNGMTGGGTGWLTMSGNVTPGETMEIRFVIFDIGDQFWDSLVLFDNWQWSVQAAQPGVTPG